MPRDDFSKRRRKLAEKDEDRWLFFVLPFDVALEEVVQAIIYSFKNKESRPVNHSY
jgi:hypothetical protein